MCRKETLEGLGRARRAIRTLFNRCPDCFVRRRPNHGVLPRIPTTKHRSRFCQDFPARLYRSTLGIASLISHNQPSLASILGLRIAKPLAFLLHQQQRGHLVYHKQRYSTTKSVPSRMPLQMISNPACWPGNNASSDSKLKERSPSREYLIKGKSIMRRK